MPCKRRFASLLVGLFALFAAAGAWAQTPPQEPRYFAIKGARVVTVSGPVIEEGTVVVANGLVAAVGKEAPIPPEAWVINGKGLTVYPGLIDAFTDLGLQVAPARGGPPGAAQPPPAQQRPQPPPSKGPEDRPGTQPWLAAADELKLEDKRIEQWRDAGFTTALSAPRGGIFAGQGAVINLAGERPGDMVVKTPATLVISLQPVGGFTSFPGSLMGAIAYVKQVYADTAYYAQASAAYDKQPRGQERPSYDRTERVILRAQREQWPVVIPATRAGQILRTMDLAGELNLRAVLAGVHQGYDVAPQIAARKIPVLVSLKWPEKDKDADPEAEESLETLRLRDRAPSAPLALAKSGVKFAFYSDGIQNPADIRKNARKAIDAGLPADAAVRAFTLDAAEILGVSDRLGSIEPGKIANLVVTDGDLFGEKTKVKLVFVDGRKFEIREPEKKEEEKKDQAPKPAEVGR